MADVLAAEQPRLLPLPAHAFETEVMRVVSARKTPYVRFDRNSYSIPHAYRQRPLTLLASPTTVRVLAGTEEIARHARSYDTGHVIEDEAHVRGLIEATRQTNPSSARDRLRLSVPVVALLLERVATRGESLRVHVARLLSLIDDYGPQELTAGHRAGARARRARRGRHRSHPRDAPAATRPQAWCCPTAPVSGIWTATRR